ncbi:SMODS domain-containing nucleotidyltransferase [Mycobacterium kansasii]|uniref:SMODS domain-containing nucleotidyltransferase n=1 Tax=Mycobacterium kansasii TaxID=1768 RepID=UPI00195AA08C|nr:nucleotidyltransferase [Mycobacterium kansasii]
MSSGHYGLDVGQGSCDVGVYEAFNAYQQTIDADPAHVELARERRDVFIGALEKVDDVKGIVNSGSLERRTQLEPIHDVDLILVFDTSAVPEWGSPGSSSDYALARAHDEVVARLGLSRGTDSKLVRRADTRDHAVKCFVDPPDDEHPFTVDVMPVIRQADNTLLIPSTKAQEWSTADPEYLIDKVRRHHEEWSFFRPMVRLLKNWRKSVNSETRIKSLVMEVLALQCLPHAGNRPEALRQFFSAAAVQVNLGVEDAAGHCGPIQPDLDIVALRDALLDAADLAGRACDQAARTDVDGAQRTWQELFGPDFPAPPKKTVPNAPIAPVPLITDSPQG